MSHVAWFVCLLGTWVSHAEMAELIEMPFGGFDSREPKEPCIRWGRDPSMGRGSFWGCPTHCKAVVYAAIGIIWSLIKASSRRDHLFFITAQHAFCHNSLSTC